MRSRAEATGRMVIGTRWVARRHRPMARCSQISACGERFCSGRTSSAGRSCGPGAISRSQQREKRLQRLGERLGLLVAIYYNNQRTVRVCHKKDRIDRFSSGGQAGNGDIAASREAAQQLPGSLAPCPSPGTDL